jgi:hypothetical protein
MNGEQRNMDRYPALLILVQREDVGYVKNVLLFHAHVFA